MQDLFTEQNPVFNNKGIEKREYAIEKLFWNGR